MIKDGNSKIKRIMDGNEKIKRVYDGDTLVWSGGNIATYHLDVNNIKTAEVDCDDNCLSEKYVAPFGYKTAKPGYTWVGWKKETSASADNLITSEIMGEDPTSFHAVYKHPVALAYNANGGSGTTTQSAQTQYYNNGKYSGIQLANNNFNRPGYTFSKWAAGSVNGAQYDAASWTDKINQNTTLYAVWKLNGFEDVSLSNFSNLYQAAYESGYVKLGSAIGADQTGSAVWAKRIDFSKILTIRIYYGCHVADQGTGFRIYKCASVSALGTEIASTGRLSPANIDANGQYVDVDISALTGTGYIGIKGHTDGSYTKIGRIQYR